MIGMPFYESNIEGYTRWDKPAFVRLRASLLVNTVIGLGLVALFAAFGFQDIKGHFWRRFFEFQLYTHCTGDLAVLTIPPVAVRLTRMEGWRKWPPYLTLLAAVGIAGPALATTLLFAVGLVGGNEFGGEFIYSARIGVLVTMMMGVATYTIEMLRGQVQKTTLQLRTQQLERERALKLAAEARLGSLQSRLQPHFLFNTINSILALLREDPGRAEEMLERLARLLRFALDSQQAPVVRVSEELKLVKDYLEIEQTRFGERLRYTIDPGEETGDVEIPAYSLQTLVENSMKHAIAPRRDGGAIGIKVARNGHELVAEVCDDGPGFTAEAMRAGHGLDMLEQRLAALYGEEASLEITQPQRGACVRLRMTVGRK